MERKNLEDKEQAGETTDSPAGYIYRGIRYGGTMSEATKHPSAELKADDDGLKPPVMSDGPPDFSSTRQGEPQESVVDRPWWEYGSNPGDSADDDPDSGPGYYYMGVRYGGPEPQTEEPADDDPVNPLVASLGAHKPEETPRSVVEPEFMAGPVARPKEQPTAPPAQTEVGEEASASPSGWGAVSAPEEAAEKPGAAFGVPAVPLAEPEQQAGKQAEPSGEGVTTEGAGSGWSPAATGLPPAMQELAANSPFERVHSLVVAFCPDEMLLMETLEHPLPAWAPVAMSAARDDMERRVAQRTPIDAAEYLRLAIAESLMGLHDEAETHLKEALPRSDRLGPVLNALAVTSAARGKIDPAVVYAREALQESGGEDSVRAAVASNLGEFHRLQGNETLAAEAYETAIESLGTQGDPRWLSRLHLGAGRLYRQMDQADKAHMHLSDAVRLFEEAGDDVGRVRALAALGTTLTESGSHDLAVRNLEEGIRICLRTVDRPAAALVQHEIGVAYMAQDQLTRALAYLQSALTLYRELGDRAGEGAALGNIAKIHDLRGDVDEAQRVREAGSRLMTHKQTG